MTQKEILTGLVLECLDSRKWRYDIQDQDDQRFTLSFGMNLKSKLSSCRVIVIINQDSIQVLAICPIKATEDVYGPVTEYLTRANFGLIVGKFEFDYRDGEIRYQSVLPCSAGTPQMKDVERVLDVPFLMMQRYGNGLMKNLMGIGYPEEDIREAQNDQ